MFVAEPLYAQPVVSPQQQLENQQQVDTQRREAQQRDQERSAPTVHSGEQPVTMRLPTLGEQPCAQVSSMQLDGPSADQFPWLQAFFQPFSNQCLGQKSLQALQDNLNDGLQASGYITSKVVLAEHAVVADTVRLKLMAGRIGQFRLLEPAKQANEAPQDITDWHDTMAFAMAMPAKPGALLNIRDLDHAAETIQRLGYELEQYIVPQTPSQPGMDAVHDVVVAWVRPSRRWQASVDMDNSLAPVFGRTRLNTQLGLSNLLGLADQIQLSSSGNVESRGSQSKQNSQYLSLSIPWGYHRFSITQSNSDSSLGIAGTTVSFTSRRKDSDTQMAWAYTLYRDSHYKITPEFTQGWRKGSSHIEDVELVVQRRHARTRGLNLNISWVGPGQQVQSSLGVTQISRQHHEDDDFFFVDEPLRATTRRWTGQWQHAFSSQSLIGAHVRAYALQWDVQSTRHPTPLSSDMSLGGRYTVRGFTGDQTLSASDGMWLRNEWQFNPHSSAQLLGMAVSPYVGLDAGRVWGERAASLASRERWVAGLAIGLRGQWRTSIGPCSFDASISTPLHGMHFTGSSRPSLVPYLSLTLAF